MYIVHVSTWSSKMNPKPYTVFYQIANLFIFFAHETFQLIFFTDTTIIYLDNYIKKAAENSGPCPIPGCRSKSVMINLTENYDPPFLGVPCIYCQSKEAGCEWVRKLDELSMHLKEEYSFVKEVHVCPYDYGMHVQHKSIKDHNKVCEFFLVVNATSLR